MSDTIRDRSVRAQKRNIRHRVDVGGAYIFERLISINTRRLKSCASVMTDTADDGHVTMAEDSNCTPHAVPAAKQYEECANTRHPEGGGIHTNGNDLR